MSKTTLRILMADGAVVATFTPTLTPEQYAELHALVEKPAIKVELRDAIAWAAKIWGVKVDFDSETV